MLKRKLLLIASSEAPGACHAASLSAAARLKHDVHGAGSCSMLTSSAET